MYTVYYAYVCMEYTNDNDKKYSKTVILWNIITLTITYCYNAKLNFQ